MRLVSPLLYRQIQKAIQRALTVELARSPVCVIIFCVLEKLPLQNPAKFQVHAVLLFLFSILEGDERERSHERIRYSPRPYEDNRRTYYHDRESSPYESHRHSPPREKYEQRDKPQER